MKERWLNDVSIPYVIVLGDPDLDQEHVYDETTRVCILRCDDSYKGLTDKMPKVFKFIRNTFNPDFLVKIDDDVIVNLDRFNAFLKNVRQEYAGVLTVNTLEKYSYCTGPIYYLGKRALSILAEHYLYAERHVEDYATAATLFEKGPIYPTYATLYTDNQRVFIEHNPVAFHDVERSCFPKEDVFEKVKFLSPVKPA